MLDRRLTLRDAVLVTGWLAIVFCAAGLTDHATLLVSVAAVLSGTAFVLNDLRQLRTRAIEPITLFALGFAITGIANTAAVLSIARLGNLSPYALYLREEFVFLAVCLHLVGGIATIAGYRLLGSRAPAQLLASALPTVAVHSTARSIALGGSTAALVGLTANVLPISGRFGTIANLIGLAPTIVVFVFARFGASRRRRAFLIAAIALACLNAGQAALFAYLRSEILMPIVALLLGVMLGARSIRALRTAYLVPAYVGVGLFLTYFSVLGVVRGASGSDRLQAISDESHAIRAASSVPKATLAARLSNVNQLSQIGALVQSDGFLDGQTLSYLAYAFVPRLLWPAKPTIAKGQWFAFKIGQAMLQADGSYSNSVNMTVPGELYLNYGWLGTVIGTLLFGAMLAVFWSKAKFWSAADNALGTAFGFYLLWVGLGLGADLQVLVTITATYIVFAALRVAALLLPGSSSFGSVHSRRIGTAQPSVGA